MRYRCEKGRGGAYEKKAIVWTREEHGIRPDSLDARAVSIVRALQRAGYESYIVGGAVRDLVLGNTPKDFDIVTSATPMQIKRCIRGSRIIGKRFRLVHAYSGDKIFEIATFRSMEEGTTSNVFGTIADDVMRRDFTCNALFYDPVEDIVVDYFLPSGALADIKDKVLKPVIPLNIIFSDDPVRMIRAVKYAASCGFTMPNAVAKGIKKDRALLAQVSSSRLTEELSKIIHSKCARVIIEELYKTELWEYLQPASFYKMKSDPAFLQEYLQGFDNSCDNLSRKGGALLPLFKTHLESQVDWSSPQKQDYKTVFSIARSFIAPAGLPRFELEAALQLVFSEHNTVIKKPKRPHHRRAR